jgi:hypothetical protein
MAKFNGINDYAFSGHILKLIRQFSLLFLPVNSVHAEVKQPVHILPSEHS